MKQTLWIISELFPPEETSTGYIMGEIANAMCSKYNVKVIAGPAVYDKNKKQDANSNFVLDDSIELINADAVPEDRNNKISRIKKFLIMSWRLYHIAKRNIKEGDHVLMVTNPFPLITLMGHLRKHRQFTLNMLVHDIMPEGLYTDMHIPPLIYKIAEHIFNKAYYSTDLLVSIGRDMNEVLENKMESVERNKEKWPKISVIENWGDVEKIQPAEPLNDEKIIIQYAGNIGNAQGVGEFVDVMHEAGCSQVAFSIWGTGSAEDSIKEMVREYGMEENVSFHGAYLRSEQHVVLNTCDIALVRLVKGMYGLGVPSKSYNIMAAGKPILYIGERGSEIWRVVEEYGNGVCFEPWDKEGLIAFLQGLSADSRPSLIKMGQISRRLAEEKYSKGIILHRFVEEV